MVDRGQGGLLQRGLGGQRDFYSGNQGALLVVSPGLSRDAPPPCRFLKRQTPMPVAMPPPPSFLRRRWASTRSCARRPSPTRPSENTSRRWVCVCVGGYGWVGVTVCWCHSLFVSEPLSTCVITRCHVPPPPLSILSSWSPTPSRSAPSAASQPTSRSWRRASKTSPRYYRGHGPCIRT